MSFQIVRNDITKIYADAIVDTANPQPICAGGTDYAIYTAAGKEELLKERKWIGEMKRGETMATHAFRLHARYIIHTVGPIWTDGDHGEFETLASCYHKSLQLAEMLQCESIAFPLISTGVYGFPKDRALKIAADTIRCFLKEHDMKVILVVFDRESYEVSGAFAKKVHSFIDEQTASDRETAEYLPDLQQGMCTCEAAKLKAPASAPSDESLDEILSHPQESFRAYLLRLIYESGRSNAEIYNAANIDRRLFSKIISIPDYHPKKQTVMALAVALHLSLEQAESFLAKAGYAFSSASKADLIVQYCILHQQYDIIDINILLFDYNQPQLGN